MLLLAACDPTTTDRGDGSDAPGSSPRPGGRITFGVLGEPRTLDPYSKLASDLTWTMLRPVYRSLYALHPGGGQLQDLATELLPAKKGVVVVLRRARWSDGTPIRDRDVVASLNRAVAAGRLPGIERVVDGGKHAVRLIGDASNVPKILATGSMVLPRGRFDPQRFSGPFGIVNRVPGLEVVYRPIEDAEPRPLLDELRVVSVVSTEMLIELLERGDLDAAAVPSTVNLEAILRERDLGVAGRLGWESIHLDMEGLDDLGARRAVAGAIDRALLAEGFIRDLGRVANSLAAGPGDRGSAGPFRRPPAADGGGLRVELAAPTGDGLLGLLQRPIHDQLEEAGFVVDVVSIDPRTFYSEWVLTDPVDLALRRGAGIPGLGREPQTLKELAAMPLFQVETVIASRPGVLGLQPNPTIDGPLWNAYEWSKEPEQ